MSWRRSDAIRLALAVAGLLISAYLTLVHYDTAVPIACTNTGIINCADVLTSAQSVWFGLPVAVFGMAWFLVAGGLAVAGLRAGDPARWRQASLAWTLVGAATVVFLVYEELVVINRICEWCTMVHLIVLASLVLVVIASDEADPDPDGDPTH